MGIVVAVLVGIPAGIWLIAFMVRALYKGPGRDVLVPPGSPEDWRKRARRNGN